MGSWWGERYAAVKEHKLEEVRYANKNGNTFFLPSGSVFSAIYFVTVTLFFPFSLSYPVNYISDVVEFSNNQFFQ